MAIFYALLNIAEINSYILIKTMSHAYKQTVRYIFFFFLKNLSINHVRPFLQARSNISTLPPSIRSLIRKHVGDERKDIKDDTPKEIGRCVLCGRIKNNNTTVVCSE